jgi:hypothetical protein
MLFPAIHHVLTQNSLSQRFHIIRPNEYLADKVSDFLRELNLPITLITADDAELISENSRIFLPRWDYEVFFLTMFKWSSATFDNEYKKFSGFENSMHIKTLMDSIRKDPNQFKDVLLEKLELVKTYILKLISFDLNTKSKLTNKILLIERHAVPKSIRYSQQVNKFGYGMLNRFILNMNDVESRLTSEGIPVVRYIPGNESILNQITAFSVCKGIFGLRGAEVANLHWLHKSAFALIVNPADILPGVSPGKMLCNWNDAKYDEIETNLGPYINVDIEEVLKKIKTSLV